MVVVDGVSPNGTRCSPEAIRTVQYSCMRPLARFTRGPAGPPLPLEPDVTLALIAGYRVVRRVASSERSDVYVGVAPVRPTVTAAGGAVPEPNDRGVPVILKVFRSAAEQSGVEREVRALTMLGSGQLATLLDLGTLPDGRTVLVLEHVTGGSLSRHLEQQRWVRPGEAVTILAPVVAALAQLHRIGLVHTGLNLSSVLFDSTGRPVVTGLGALRDLPGPGPRRTDALGSVRAQVGLLVCAVLDQVHPGDAAGDARQALSRWCAPLGLRERASTVDELEHLLFAWAEAVPVRPNRGRARAGATQPEVSGQLLRRALPDAHTGQPPTASAGGRERQSGFERALYALSSHGRAVAVRLRTLKMPEPLSRTISAGRFARRGPLFLAVAVAVATAGLAFIAFGTPKTMNAPKAQTPSISASSAHATPADLTDEAVSDDDPVLAVPALLERRSQCLHEASVICLDGVHQAQSAALTEDTYALRMIQQGGEAPDRDPLETWTVALVDRAGDAALVSLQAPDPKRRPASVLVVKGEAGWRIRAIFDY